MRVRVRIAPSPTGYPHIGTIWQALVNFSFAKKHQGQFIVRIEDTDKKRLVPGAEKKLFKALTWFGLTPDESPVHKGSYGPYRQSERLDLYKKYAQILVDKNKAYLCFCSQKRIDKVRKEKQKKGQPAMYDGFCRKIDPQKAEERVKKGEKHVIRLKVPKNKIIIVNDLLRGKIKFDSSLVDDQILIKSDGFPTYQLAVVVDDYLMKISHMVRGEEWISSAPKPVLIYEFLGWKKPVFVHTPLLRNPDKSKLSKRQGQTAVSWYQENGYLSEAILNFLALLGWSHPQEKTIFSFQEFIKHFDLKDLSPVGPIVDLKKLNYINGVYIRETDNKKLLQLIKPYLKFKIKDEKLKKIIPLIKERIVKLTDANDLIDFFIKDIKYSPKLLLSKGGDKKLVKQQLEAVVKELSAIKDWNLKNITQSMQDLCNKNNWNRSQFFMVLRVAVTCKTISPPLFESMEILTKEKTLQRVKTAINCLAK